MAEYPPGVLHLVATPIGNLEDVTLRALRVLGEVALIAAEDTRRTARLLQHYSIATPTTSFHEHNERQKQGHLLARLRRGQSIALVADAGTPTISDPGSRLVGAAIAGGIQVAVVPGPCAVLTALVGSGLPGESFTFVGFPPNRAKARLSWLKSLAEEPRTLVFFEAPHRIRATLSQALEVWGDREIALGRELTKRHEEFVKGPISHVLSHLEAPRGEMTIVVNRMDRAATFSAIPEGSMLWNELGTITNTQHLSRRGGVVVMAKKYGVSPKYMYAAVEKSRKYVE